MQVRQAHSDLVEARRAERGANQRREQQSEVERRMKLAIEEAEHVKAELERVREEAKGAASRQQVTKERPNLPELARTCPMARLSTAPIACSPDCQAEYRPNCMQP
jgi:hypothetical protein